MFRRSTPYKKFGRLESSSLIILEWILLSHVDQMPLHRNESSPQINMGINGLDAYVKEIVTCLENA